MGQMAEKKRYRIALSFSAVFEGDSEADALLAATFELKYHYKDAKGLSASTICEVPAEPKPSTAMDDAPFADQVTVLPDPLPLVPEVPTGTTADDFPF
jgi:hypothetical protein